jgi:hypothetical protein
VWIQILEVVYSQHFTSQSLGLGELGGVNERGERENTSAKYILVENLGFCFLLYTTVA